MPALRSGRDYHLAESRRVTEPLLGEVQLWEAHCDACGWVGPERYSVGDAEDDALAHDVAENA